jgi:serine/threonine protein kinase
MFDPKTGEIKIVDNDNVGVEGHSTSDVRGIPDYMAPEILQNIATVPSKKTDYHSLAIFLFQLWCWHHPFEGRNVVEGCRCFDRPAKVKFFGESPVFIFSETDTSNDLPKIVDQGTKDEEKYSYVHDFWQSCHSDLQKLFHSAFGEGVANPNKRVIETRWIKVFGKIYDTVTVCPDCKADNCYASNKPCWHCKKIYQPPILLRIKNKNNNTISGELAVITQKQLVDRHFNKKGGHVHGKFIAHPKDPNALGLQNTSGSEWDFVNQKGETVPVAIGRSIPVNANNTIDFKNNYSGHFEEAK